MSRSQVQPFSSSINRRHGQSSHRLLPGTRPPSSLIPSPQNSQRDHLKMSVRPYRDPANPPMASRCIGIQPRLFPVSYRAFAICPPAASPASFPTLFSVHSGAGLVHISSKCHLVLTLGTLNCPPAKNALPSDGGMVYLLTSPRLLAKPLPQKGLLTSLK